MIDLINAVRDELLPCVGSIQEATQEAWWLLEKLLDETKLSLLTSEVVELSSQQLAILNRWVNDRVQKKKPLQYILGSVPFCDLEILVEPPILIPRPETEEWVTWLIDQLAQAQEKPLKILDLCTGSGCIALALAQALPQATVIGIDINPQAIELAEKNKAHNRISNVTFMLSDLDQVLTQDMRFDLIVSNPPYLAQAEYDNLDPEVKQWEDVRALVAENDGLDFYRRIAQIAALRLAKNNVSFPVIVLELGTVSEPIQEILKKAGFKGVSLHTDIQGKRRWIAAHLTEKSG